MKFKSRKGGIKFDPGSKFEPFCRNCVRLYVSCTIWVKNKVSDVYFVTICFSFFIINPEISVHALLLPSIIANGHSVLSLHTISPLKDDGSHGSTLCPTSMIMDPMAPYYAPLDDYGYHGSTLCPHQLWWLPWIHTLHPHWLWLPHDEEDLVRELPLQKRITGFVERWLSGTGWSAPKKIRKSVFWKQIINFRSFLLKSQNYHNFWCTQIVE